MARARNPNLKKANTEVEFTYEHIQELDKCRRDPVYFIKKYVRIQHPIKGAIPFYLYDYQEEMVRAYADNRYVVVLSARQTGKALSLDTPIPTPTGWTTMGDIQPDDMVLDDNGQPVRVEAISDVMFDHTCYQITFSTGDTVVADAEHLWEVKDEYTRKVKILTTQQMVDTNYINEKNQARYTVKVTKPVELPEQKLDIDPYTLGVWLGDGTSRCGEITTHQDDLEIYEYVDQQYNINQRLDSNKTKRVYRTTLFGLRTDLQKYGLVQNKHIPIIYKRASYGQRLALLQGLMDTDGTVDSLGRGGCDITLSNKTLAEDVYELISSLGLKPTFKERYVNGFVRYEVKFSAYKNEVPVFRLKRKLMLMKEDPHPTRKQSTKKRSIQKIEKVKSRPVKCIRVANKNHLFLFGRGFIPTHNSITSGAFLLWYAVFNFDKTILIASNKNSNAMEMIHRIKFAYENLPHWLKPGIQEDGYNKHAIGFDNGTRIISEATSENSGRGLSISLLYLDEFAFVQPAIQEEFWTSISPTLSTGGACIMTSTPNGDINIFAQIWRGSQVDANGFKPLRVYWDQPPGRDEAFKEEEIGRIGERQWRQEYECEFLSSDALLIKSVTLQNITAAIKDIRPKFVIDNSVVFWDDIKQGHTYLVGVDPATGAGSDFTVISIFEFPSLIQVAEYRSNTMSTNDAYKVLKKTLMYLQKKDTTVYFSIENNGVGEGIISLFEADEDQPLDVEFVSETGRDRRGMTTVSRTKMRACVNLREMVEKNNLHVRSPILLNELKTFTRRRGSYAAQTGSTDDCISAVLIVIRLIEEIATYDQQAFDKLYAGGHDMDEWSAEDIDVYDEDSMPLPMLFQ